MSPKLITRRPATLLLAAGATLAVVASASAAVIVYNNTFSSRASLQELKKTGGGKGCDRSFRQRSKSMGLAVTGRRLCKYSPPVIGDSPQPDHVVIVKGKIITAETPKALRKGAYLALQVRSGHGGFYELQVRPSGRRFRLLRDPESATVAAAGRDDAINPLKRANTLALQARGARVVARVNGRRVASVLDPNPDALDGRRVAFGLGSRKDSNRAVIGAFDNLRVGIP